MSRLLALGALGMLGTGTAASAANKLDCNRLSYADDLSNLSLAIVIGRKVNFTAGQSETPICPSAAAQCRQRARIVKADKVVIDARNTAGPYICAAFIDAKGQETDGWLPAASLKQLTARPTWRGRWERNSSATISVKPTSNSAAVADGEATWGSGADMREGSFKVTIDPRQPVQDFATDGEKQVPYSEAGKYDCALRMRVLAPYLFAVDNRSCGGANVSFTGLYRTR